MALSLVPFVFVTTIVSEEPILAVNEIALATSPLDTNATCPPEILTSQPTTASISTPPSVDVNAMALSLVPASLTIVIV